MRPVLLILILFYRSLAFGQDDPVKLCDKAFNYYLYGKDIDSALYYYSLIQKNFPEFRPGYINNVMGSCYWKKGNKVLANSYFLLSLQKPDTNALYPEKACIYIGDMFLESGDYASALAYYDSSTSFYRIKSLRISRHRYKEGDIETIYKKAICLDKLNRPDTAINIMTPHIFTEFEDPRIDSSQEVKVVDFYISLLKKKYSEKQIKKEFKKALDGLTYKREVDSSLLKNEPSWKQIIVDCQISFLHKWVILFQGGIGVNNFDDDLPIGWRKEDIVENLRKTLAYKKLKSL